MPLVSAAHWYDDYTGAGWGIGPRQSAQRPPPIHNPPIADFYPQGQFAAAWGMAYLPPQQVRQPQRGEAERRVFPLSQDVDPSVYVATLAVYDYRPGPRQRFIPDAPMTLPIQPVSIGWFLDSGRAPPPVVQRARVHTDRPFVPYPAEGVISFDVVPSRPPWTVPPRTPIVTQETPQPALMPPLFVPGPVERGWPTAKVQSTVTEFRVGPPLPDVTNYPAAWMDVVCYRPPQRALQRPVHTPDDAAIDYYVSPAQVSVYTAALTVPTSPPPRAATPQRWDAFGPVLDSTLVFDPAKSAGLWGAISPVNRIVQPGVWGGGIYQTQAADPPWIGTSVIIVAGPYYVSAGQIFTAGAVIGQVVEE